MRLTPALLVWSDCQEICLVGAIRVQSLYYPGASGGSPNWVSSTEVFYLPRLNTAVYSALPGTESRVLWKLLVSMYATQKGKSREAIACCVEADFLLHSDTEVEFVLLLGLSPPNH